MPAYIITYDLSEAGQNYNDLIESIKKSYPSHWHMMQSKWIVSTSSSASDIRDHLSSFIDSNDKLFVAKLSGEAAWKGLSKEGSDWLKKVLS